MLCQKIVPVRKFTLNKKLNTLLGVILFITLCQLLSKSIGSYIFPGPFLTIKETIRLLTLNYTWQCIYYSLLRLFGGFAVAFIIGLILGVLSGNFYFIKELLNPMIVAVKSIPTASLVFLFIVLSGARNASVYIVILVAFPIIYDGVSSGIENIDRDIIDASRLDGASFIYENIKVKLPLALPYIFVSVSSSFALSFKIEIMAEVITGTTFPGLGSAISTVRKIEPANLAPVFAYSLIAIIIALILTFVSKKIKIMK